MNKLVKGSIAGAAGIALLLGGAGTLAVWNDSTTLASAGSITAGTLTINEVAGGGWDETPGLIVPGDTFVYTKELSIAATGNNLAFEVTHNIGTLLAATTFTTANVVTTDVDVKLDGDSVAPVDGKYQADAGVYTVDVTVTVDFPVTTDGLTDQGATVNLATAAVTVTQIAQ